MRKIFALLLAVMIVVSMAVSASATTPALKIPHIEIPDISGRVEVKLPQSFWAGYFVRNPFRIDFSKINFNW